MNKEISAVLFDFGNVIIDIDLQKTIDAFADLTLKSAKQVKTLFDEADIYRKYETGFYNDDEFRDVMRQLLGFPLNDNEIDKAWNALLISSPRHRIEYLERLRIEMPIYMLSNTNKIHIDWCTRYYHKEFGYNNFRNLFRTAFMSYEMGMWKPDKEIYESVLKEINLKPNQVLFLDDNIHNIASAKEMGINCILIEKHTCFTEILKNYFPDV